MPTARVLVLTSLFLWSAGYYAQATPFDVTSVGGSDGPFFHSASGTSNGVSWTVSGANGDSFYSWIPATVVNGTYQGFTGGNYTPALPNTDVLHTFGTDMTITFSQNIFSILFYLKETGGSSTLDFGITPQVVSGAVTINGTKVRGTATGGVVRFSNLNTNNLTSSTSIFDGMDAAWVVESVESVPDTSSSAALLGVALAGIGWMRRKLSA